MSAGGVARELLLLLLIVNSWALMFSLFVIPPPALPEVAPLPSPTPPPRTSAQGSFCVFVFLFGIKDTQMNKQHELMGIFICIYTFIYIRIMRDRHTYMKRRREKMDKNNYSGRNFGVSIR